MECNDDNANAAADGVYAGMMALVTIMMMMLQKKMIEINSTHRQEKYIDADHLHSHIAVIFIIAIMTPTCSQRIHCIIGDRRAVQLQMFGDLVQVEVVDD